MTGTETGIGDSTSEVGYQNEMVVTHYEDPKKISALEH
jgi:hypothetical protein